MNNSYILEKCLEKFIEDNQLGDKDKSTAFELFSLLQTTKEFDLSYDEIEDAIVDGSHDGGIDCFLILLNGQPLYTVEQIGETRITEDSKLTIFITQSKLEKSFKESAIDKLHISIPLVLNLELGESELFQRFNSSLVEKILIFQRAWLDCTVNKAKIFINLTYSCKSEFIETNKSFDSKTTQLIEVIKDKMGINTVSFSLFSAKAYQPPCNSNSGKIQSQFHIHKMNLAMLGL
jgi:hypothetical protein